ncbi:ribokinase [Alkalihalobacillus sp. AL-G]|uniref:ribokinase n=1 Tax=Alkalihalobacillus sp. AL-G TaxID=2926399 RepID=UPI00272B7E7A|nr:ribokinase [Alkalihalobacillus sp. AL-G]WLD93840.1 ribokinase [Alkalihalobacillus sp. AL-G]
MNILVIGSFMMDLVVRTPRAPQKGETIIGTHFSRYPGGKGANQAVSAARLGGDVTMVGMLGNDSFGDDILEELQINQINTKFILRDNTSSTGIGLVTVEEDGNNRIVIVPSANLNYRPTDLVNVESLIEKADILLVQLEMDISVTEEAISCAKQYGVPVILNPAPGRKLEDHLFEKVTYLTPNETEAELLTGIKINSIEDVKEAGNVLLSKGVENVVITMADKGALIVNQLGSYHVPGYPVDIKDTVAAGDAFNGGLAIGVASGKSLKDAIHFANAVGALTVTKEGAIPSVPYLNEVQEFIKKFEASNKVN